MKLNILNSREYEDAIDLLQPSHPLSSPTPPAPNPFQHQSLCQWPLHMRRPKYWSFSFSISPSREHPGLIPLGWTGWISLQSKGLSRVFSNTTVLKNQFFALSFYHSPSLTSIHDHQKNHSFDQTELCWQSNVSAFQYAISVQFSSFAQSCQTLCDSMDCSIPGSSVHGIFQAIGLEWIAISFSRGSSQPRDRTLVSRIVDRGFTI